MPEFLEKIRRSRDVSRVTIHARKAWLQGLSPKENRDIPPLDYDLVHRMKAGNFRELHISINGGIATAWRRPRPHLDRGLDGVMIGRAAYHQPTDVYCAAADPEIFATGDRTAIPLDGRASAMLPYIETHLSARRAACMRSRATC